MSWISLVLLLIQHGPAIISLVTEIWELIGKLGGKEQATFKAELASAAQDYRKSKDRRRLLELRGRLRRTCYGEGCEASF